MTYGSIQGVKDNLPKLRKYIKTDNDPTLQADLDITETTVTNVLNLITEQINAALKSKYDVPFASPPAVINGITNDLAAFRISRSYMITIDAADNQQLNSLRKDAKDLLADLASGAAQIPGIKETASQSIEDQLDDLNLDTDEEIFDLEDAASWQARL
jgi:phage gp36-like protein